MQNICPKYFLGANSCEGFVSHFGDSFSHTAAWRALLIKGGPGTGKSSFMKRIASEAIKKGYTVELGMCSSDPNSLDGIIIKELKTVLLDATSPHVVEPAYPAACEEIVNLGEFWHGDILRKNRAEIIAVTNKNRQLHKTASSYIKAAGELIYDSYKLSLVYTDIKKAEQAGIKTARRILTPKQTPVPHEWVRFISAITPKGIIAYPDTVDKFYENIIVIDDKHGALTVYLEAIRRVALAYGYEIITLKSPFLPSKITDGILVPELSLAVVRETEYCRFSENHRRLHARRFADVELMHKFRPRTVTNRRLARELLGSGCKTLQNAKLTHDDIERFYIDAMDFEALNRYTDRVCKDILG